MDFRVLGPLEVRDRGHPIALGGSRQRSVLAVLLLNAGEVVSTDRLLLDLWGESPPKTAMTALQGYVSQLRRALEPNRPAGESSVILTREPGYVIAIEPQQLDVARFERLRANASEAMARGDARTAATELEKALALWRGKALADLVNEPFASEAARRLEDMRVTAIEERIDAELALGRDRELLTVIQSLVDREPLRERPREQLMLALYRSGRQADALRAYDDARRALVSELGIEPGHGLRRLQQRILEQDPTLDAVPADRGSPAHHAIRTGRGRGVAVAVSLLAVAITLLVLWLSGSSGHSGHRVSGNSVALISSTGADVRDSFAVGGDPTSVTVGAGAVWVLNADEQTVTRIDLATHQQRTFGTGGVPTDIAAGDGSLWVGDGTQQRAQFVGPVTTTVSRLDPDSAAVIAKIALPPTRGAVTNTSDYHIAVGTDGVWVINPDQTVSRIDPATNRIAARIAGVRAVAVASGTGGTWALEDSGTIARLDPRGDRVLQRIRIPASSLTSITVGGGAIWSTDPDQGTLWRVNPTPEAVERTIPLAVGVTDVAFGAGAAWVANGLNGTISRVDADTNRATNTIAVGNTPGRLAVGSGGVWVAVPGAPGGAVPTASQGNAGVQALPAAVCGPVYFGGEGPPQRLIVSDLPLRGAPGLPTRQMSAAIAYVLREHNFRAGRFRLGYQSCDDSTAQSAIYDDRKCVSNAKAWVSNQLVIGVIGPFNSGCAYDELPVTNRGGPLAMISPTNSDVALTHAGPLTPPDATARLYPTGVRNYVRIYPSDDLQGAAMAEFARRQGLKRVYVVDDNGYGKTTTASFRRAAQHLGVRIAGSSSWDPGAADYGRLAERIARSKVDGVYASGLIDSNGGAVIRAMRQRLGMRVAILASNGFLPIADLFRSAGAAAAGVYVSTEPLANGQLGLAGREFVTHFAATQHRVPVHHAAVYAAQATEALLAAIARSNGTRASVTLALRTTCIREGILGSFCFDRNGDSTSAPITIVRAARPGGSHAVESTDGAHIVAVINPSRALTR